MFKKMSAFVRTKMGSKFRGLGNESIIVYLTKHQFSGTLDIFLL